MLTNKLQLLGTKFPKPPTRVLPLNPAGDFRHPYPLLCSPSMQTDRRYMVGGTLKAKFHYSMWWQTGPKLVADLPARATS